jgi:hypothetical protein
MLKPLFFLYFSKNLANSILQCTSSNFKDPIHSLKFYVLQLGSCASFIVCNQIQFSFTSIVNFTMGYYLIWRQFLYRFNSKSNTKSSCMATLAIVEQEKLA